MNPVDIEDDFINVKADHLKDFEDTGPRISRWFVTDYLKAHLCIGGIMLDQLGLGGYSLDNILMFVAVAAIASLFFGFLADHFSGDKGFGVFGNAILIGLGCMIGFFTRSEFIGHLPASDSATATVFFASVVTLLLLSACFAKRILHRCV